MKLVSDKFLAALSVPNTFIRRVDVWSNGQPVYLDLPVVDGEVTLDRTAEIMGRCTLTVAGLDWIPNLVTDLLSPFGNELRIWRGVQISPGQPSIEVIDEEVPGETITTTRTVTVTDYAEPPYSDTYVDEYGTATTRDVVITETTTGPPTVITHKTTVVPPTTELVSLGIFRIDTVRVEDPGLTVQVTGYDRSKAVQEANLEAPYVIPAGTNYVDAIRQLINDGVPGLTYNFVELIHVTPLLVFPDGEDGARWKAAQEMATSIGCELYFDGDGVCVLRLEPSVDRPAAVSVTDGDGGVLIAGQKQWTRQGAYNAVVVTSSAPDVNPPVHVMVVDDNPASPTYYYGKFGKKPRRYASPFVTTDDQGTSAGRSILAREQGIVQTITITIAPNPALEPGDVIYARRQLLGIDQINLVDSVRIGLSADDPMSLTVRTRNVT